MATLEDRVTVHIDYFKRRQERRTTQHAQLAQHLIAQLTVVSMYDGEALV